MNKKNTYIRSLSLSLVYCLFFALFVTKIARITAPMATIQLMEFAVYDIFQRFYTMDCSGDDKRYNAIQTSLDEIIGINLDTSMLDLEASKVKREKLAQLLDSLVQIEPTAIFLDYLFLPPETTYDSILIKSLIPFQDKIVLPYGLALDENEQGKFKGYTPLNHLLYEEAPSGYLFHTFMNVYDTHIRFSKVLNIQDSIPSAIYTFLDVLPNKNAEALTQGLPEEFELNLRLKYPDRCLYSKIIDGGQVLEGYMQVPKQKIIFIGLFDQVQNIYGYPVDRHNTAIDQQMAGITLILNTYLNIVNRSWLRPAQPLTVFWVNYLLCFFMLIYLQKSSSISKSSSSIPGLLFAAYIIFIISIIASLYWYYHIKFPFVINTLFLVINPRLYFILLSIFKKLLL